MDRSAVDTIRGYCYQFDKAILEVVALKKPTDYIEVETIEDVDVFKDGTLTAIQCKYYECTEYNHSVIAHPIRLMLTHFKENPNFKGNYTLYGFYKDGQHKLTLPIDILTLKNKFLTYTSNKIKYFHHIDVGASDHDLHEFIKRLIIDVNATSFEIQRDSVISSLMDEFSCERYEAEHYFYSNAINLIYNLSCNKSQRRISKKEFIDSINKTNALLNIWMYRYKGREQYLKKIRKDLFPRNLNTEPFARFFIIEISEDSSTSEIKQCIYKIKNNWSNLSKRTSSPYSPYIYIFGRNQEYIWEIKNQLFNENISFVDGYSFKGSNFSLSIMVEAMNSRDIHFQFIENEEDLNLLISNMPKRVEIFQFYKTNSLKFNNEFSLVNIQFKEFRDIQEIV